MTNFSDFYEVSVVKTISENSTSSHFSGKAENYAGRNKSTFSIGDNIDIYADIGADPPTTKIFTGIVENIEYEGEGLDEKIDISGRDYTARLLDRTVEPEVYTNLLAGSIVKDIVNKYTNNITVNNVNNSAFNIPRIAFNHTPVYDAIKELADVAGYYFYVDNDKDLHFEEKETVNSNLTFNSGNVLYANFREDRDTVFNEVWVYGDTYLDNFEETFTAGSPVGGSVFTLLYGPHNTEVTVNGSVKVGGIEGMGIIPSSGTTYLLNYYDRNIIFVSGTTLGYSSVPISGDTVFIKYDRNLPIVKVGRRQNSVDLYGKRVLKITDNEIKDPEYAVKVVNQKLDELSVPVKEGTLQLINVIDVTPGQTCIVDFPNENVNSQTYSITEANYNFVKENLLANKSLTIKVNRKIPDATDLLKDFDIRLRKLESQNISTSDILTRLEYTTGSAGIRSSGVTVWRRTNLGSSFILGKGYHGVTGPTFGGNVGSIIVSGINFLGDSRNSLTKYWSGGYT